MTEDVISPDIDKNGAVMHVEKTTSKWSEVTYKEDKASLINQINDYIKEGVYPKKLWNKKST